MQRRFPVCVSTMSIIMPRLEVYYPSIGGLENPLVQNNINNAILNLVYQLINEQGYYQNPMTEITGNFEIKTNERGVLSLSLIHYSFSGGAHGMTIMKSLTFDVETGKSYSLNELFKPGSDYVKMLSDIIKVQIKARDIQLLEEFDSIKPDQDYYIADKALVIYFQLYEIAAYVYGILQFPISVYEIQDIIRENSPLDRMFD